MAAPFSDLCIYTIKHSNDLIEGRSGTFSEKKPWTTAKKLLDEATLRGQTLTVVFSPAEQTCEIFAWAVLKDICPTSEETAYTFSNMKLLPEPRPLKTELRKRNGKPLHPDFIRPYAICRRPEWVAQA